MRMSARARRRYGLSQDVTTSVHGFGQDVISHEPYSLSQDVVVSGPSTMRGLSSLGTEPSQAIPVSTIQVAANENGIPTLVTNVWDEATRRSWMLLLPVLGLPGTLAAGVIIEGPMALLPAPVAAAVRAAANARIGATQITLAQIATAIQDSLEITRRIKAAGLRGAPYDGLFTAWARSTEALLKDLSAELEAHPTILSAVAAAKGITPEQVLSQLRTPILSKGSIAAGLGIAIADDALVLIAALIAAVLAVLIISAVVYASLDTVRDFTTQINQTVCVKMVLDAVERNENSRDVLARLPETCRPPASSSIFWLVLGGLGLAGAGYWWYRRRRRHGST